MSTNRPPIVCRFRADGTVTFANDAFRQYVGKPGESLIGLHWLTFAGDENCPGADAALSQLSESNPAVTGNRTYKAKDGTVCRVEFVYSASFDAAGRLTDIQAVGQDTTEEMQVANANRELYERIAQIAKSVPGVVYQYKLLPDGSSCFPYASEAIRDIYRVTPEAVREDASPVFEVLHPDDYDAIVASIMRSATRLEPWQHEYRVRFSDGTVRWLFGNALPIRQDDGAVLWHGFITDITDRKNVAQALVRREQQLRQAQSIAHVGSWERDFVTGSLVWSEEMYRIYGVDPATLQSPETCLANVHPEDRARTEEAFRSALENHLPMDLTHRIVAPENRIKHVRVRGETDYADDGTPLITAGTAQDVTDRVLHETALISSERRLHSIFDAMAEGLVLQGRTGNIVDANAAAERILGLSRDELLGKTSMDPEWQAVRVDGAVFPGHEHPAMVTLRTGKPLRDQIMGIRRPGHGTRWISINSMPIFEAGAIEPDLVVATFVDVTERREAELKVAESENLLKTVIANVPAMIGYWDQNARCVFGNATYAEWFGISPEELPGSSSVEVIGPEQYAKTVPHIDAVLRGEPRHFEREFIDPRGRFHIVQLTYLPYLLNGTQRGFFVFGTDVTELNRLVEERTRELAVAKDKAEAASRAKDDVLSNVSHEMRTPLHAIRSFATLGFERLGTDNIERCRGYFEKIRASGARLTHFVDNLLDLARMGSGEVRPRKVSTDLGKLVRKVVEELSVLTDEREQRISERIVASSPTADVDPMLIERVLINLLSNASKFSPLGETISVNIADAEIESGAPASDSALRITVEDRGPGIPDSELETIFAPFVQSSRTDKRTGGTGLGLPIVKKIVALHGGYVTARNLAGGGAVFEFVIPRHVASKEDSAAIAI